MMIAERTRALIALTVKSGTSTGSPIRWRLLQRGPGCHGCDAEDDDFDGDDRPEDEE